MARLSKKQKEDIIQQHMKNLHCTYEEAQQVLLDDILLDAGLDFKVSYRGQWTDEKWNFLSIDVCADMHKRIRERHKLYGRMNVYKRRSNRLTTEE